MLIGMYLMVWSSEKVWEYLIFDCLDNNRDKNGVNTSLLEFLLQNY